MFKRILAPVDLAHLDSLERALSVTAETARAHDAPVVYASVAASSPNAVAATPEAFREKLEAFAAGQAAEHGISASALALVSNDPASDLEATVLSGVAETGADLIVMASHRPGVADYFFRSHGGAVAAKADVSVLLVRDV